MLKLIVKSRCSDYEMTDLEADLVNIIYFITYLVQRAFTCKKKLHKYREVDFKFI